MLLKLPTDVLQEIATRARARRKNVRLSQEKLAARSGVSFGSIKRFENTGKISLDSLLKIAVTLESLKDFDGLFTPGTGEGMSLDDLLAEPSRKGRKRSL